MVLHGRNIIQLILVACKIMFFATSNKEKYHTKSHNFKSVLVINALRNPFAVTENYSEVIFCCRYSVLDKKDMCNMCQRDAIFASKSLAPPSSPKSFVIIRLRRLVMLFDELLVR